MVGQQYSASLLSSTLPNASNQDFFVSQYWDKNALFPLFRRNLQDWEMNDLLTLLPTLEEYRSERLHTDTEIVHGGEIHGQIQLLPHELSEWVAGQLAMEACLEN